jgi:hypothetical protein
MTEPARDSRCAECGNDLGGNAAFCQDCEDLRIWKEETDAQADYDELEWVSRQMEFPLTPETVGVFGDFLAEAEMMFEAEKAWRYAGVKVDE